MSDVEGNVGLGRFIKGQYYNKLAHCGEILGQLKMRWVLGNVTKDSS